MHHVKGALAALALAGLVGGCGLFHGPRRVTSAPPFSRDAVWDDGQSEVALYSGSATGAGGDHAVAARLVVQKEDVREATLVRTDSTTAKDGVVEAMDMTLALDVPAGAAHTHAMVSALLRRSDLRPLLETASRHEDLGIRFERIGPKGGGLVRTLVSYRPGEGEREHAIPGPHGELWWADALPVQLRGLAGETAPFERTVWLLPHALPGDDVAADEDPVEAKLRLVGTTPLSVPDGAHLARQFAVSFSGHTELYWFDAETPHAMLRMETAECRLELVNVTRLSIADHTAPGDERLLLP